MDIAVIRERARWIECMGERITGCKAAAVETGTIIWRNGMRYCIIIFPGNCGAFINGNIIGIKSKTGNGNAIAGNSATTAVISASSVVVTTATTFPARSK